MITTFTYRPSLVRIDARNFELSWYKPTRTHTHTNKQTQRQDRLQYTVPLSLVRSVMKVVVVVAAAAAAVAFILWRYITYLAGDKLRLLMQSSMGYGDLFADTWKAFTDYPIIHLKNFDTKKVIKRQFHESVVCLVSK